MINTPASGRGDRTEQPGRCITCYRMRTLFIPVLIAQSVLGEGNLRKMNYMGSCDTPDRHDVTYLDVADIWSQK